MRLLPFVLVAACWRSSPPPAAPPESPPPRTSRPLEARKSDVERMFDAFEQYAERMCACADAKCVQDLTDELTRWMQELTKDNAEPPKMTDEEQKRAADIGERMGKCMQKAMSGSAAGASGTP